MARAIVASSASRAWAVAIVAVILIQLSFGAELHVQRWKRQSCGAREFQCESGQCINQFDICDGVAHCKDGTDETAKTCQTIPCPSFGFRCAYGGCVNANAKCNGVNDCVDGSDESGCPGQPQKPPSSNSCKKNTYQCKSGTCIDNFLLCDGTQDCDDGSDETTEACRGFTCPGFAFRCDYGACIDGSGKCNGVKQCADGSDESEKKCGRRTTTTTTTTSTISPAAACKLPPQPENGQYRLGGCDPPACHPTPGDSVKLAFISYSCNPGFVLSGSDILLCESAWSAPFPSCSRAACPPLANPSRKIECKLNDKNVDCDKPMAPGTKATVECNTFYTNVKEFSDFDTTCQPNGKWSRDVTSCIPMCGEPTPDGVPFITFGQEAKYGEFPWHAGIYRLIEDTYQQVCGGSIISEKVIVTAAHCFWNVGAGTTFDTKQFRIAVGKFYRDWNNNTEPFIQTPEIERIIPHSRFRGLQRQWQDDIAVIILKVEIHMTTAVRPICVDFKKQYIQLFTAGKKGIGTAAEETENEIKTPVITQTNDVNEETSEQPEDENSPKFKPILQNSKINPKTKRKTDISNNDLLIPKAMHTLNEEEDQYDVFGKYIASEIRSLSSEYLRKKMKRKILQVFLKIGEEDSMVSNRDIEL